MKNSLKEITLKKKSSGFENVKITSSQVAADYLKQFYFDDMELFESCFILMLNNSNSTIGYAKISQGGITGTIVDVRIVAKYAIESLCTGIILAHNHPSGKLIASEADKAITKKIREGLGIFDIKLIDHLILTKESYLSFGDEGLL